MFSVRVAAPGADGAAFRRRGFNRVKFKLFSFLENTRGQATAMHFKVDDVRIREIKELAPPAHLLREFPCSEKTEELTYHTRQAIHRLLHGSDDRVLVIIGPCSMHDPKAGLEYARRLVEMKKNSSGTSSSSCASISRSPARPWAGRG